MGYNTFHISTIKLNDGYVVRNLTIRWTKHVAVWPHCYAEQSDTSALW